MNFFLLIYLFFSSFIVHQKVSLAADKPPVEICKKVIPLKPYLDKKNLKPPHEGISFDSAIVSAESVNLPQINRALDMILPFVQEKVDRDLIEISNDRLSYQLKPQYRSEEGLANFVIATSLHIFTDVYYEPSWSNFLERNQNDYKLKLINELKRVHASLNYTDTQLALTTSYYLLEHTIIGSSFQNDEPTQALVTNGINNILQALQMAVNNRTIMD